MQFDQSPTFFVPSIRGKIYLKHQSFIKREHSNHHIITKKYITQKHKKLNKTSKTILAMQNKTHISDNIRKTPNFSHNHHFLSVSVYNFHHNYHFTSVTVFSFICCRYGFDSQSPAGGRPRGEGWWRSHLGYRNDNHD